MYFTLITLAGAGEVGKKVLSFPEVTCDFSKDRLGRYVRRKAREKIEELEELFLPSILILPHFYS